MRHALSLQVLSGLLALAFAGCSGGGSGDAASSVRVRCAGGESFCLISCDLGCTQTGCAITEIAENQRLKFTFSDVLSSASVNNASVSIRTATGVEPEGDLLVSSSELTFVPRVRTVNGVSTFGFQRNETYIITIAGGVSSPFGVSSISGNRLTREFTCTVVASRGIADEDQQPPSAQLTAPLTGSTGAPLDPTIVLQFSELIDTTPLRGSLTPSSPIRYTLRRAINNAGTLTCDRDAQGTVLLGIPRLTTEMVGATPVTVVTFKPTVQLPGESCVEVVVTADLRDLSGRQAVPSTFQFFTEAGVSTPLLYSEGFSSPANLEEQVSGGTWSGGARPGLIGGDGRHGTFDPSLGGLPASEYTWNTTSVTIPASRSLNGSEYVVTDGKFYFTDFTLPVGVTLNFTGPIPPQIYVRGKARVEGTIKLNGAAMTTFNGRGATNAPAPFIPGQPGGAPGPGGGAGGTGGKECEGTGPQSQVINGTLVWLNNGQNGEDVKLLAGHAYVTSVAGTGGRGGTLHPSNGLVPPANTSTALSGIYNPFFAAGGSGGGFSIAGGTATVNPFPLLQVSPIPAAGSLFSLFPYPPVSPPVGYSSLNHFVVGGSGGGGGASHSFGTFNLASGPYDRYIAGAGGSGGGGALALRAGNDLTITTGASLQAKGGPGVLIRGHDSVSTLNVNWGVTSPGGGGSGGSFLLQSGTTLTVSGTIDTAGGDGSRTGQIAVAQYNVTSAAGAGSAGFYRLEAGTVVNFAGVSCVPTYNAGNNAGTLTDRDTFSGCRSLWRGTNLIFPPQWLRYELEVDTDGNGTTDVIFTDSGDVGTQVANDPNGPVVIQFQGAQLAQSSTTPIEGTEGPWRYGIGAGSVPGISLDSATAFRFMMTFNRGLYPDCVVKALRVHART
jgi:hypothetical protein